MKILLFITILSLSIFSSQDSGKFGWRKLADKEGLYIEFLFYSEADNTNNGVVVKLENKNDHSVEYDFDLIFRAEDEEKTQNVKGLLLPKQILTGSNEGLFWVPFKNGKFISEVGLKNLKAGKKKEDRNPPEN
ncbi:MAG: hypothetical protein KKA84_14320 [Bacteroidetes bacterium]|nr:hypothetical protein [Bacteroidota bacterium]